MTSNEKQTNVASHENFMQFICNKGNRVFLAVAIAIGVFEFILFKLLYPFPDFFSDSYSYIYAASKNLSISIWPIGYSKFLLAFHYFTHSDTMLIAFQFFLFELSAIYFFFSFLFFYVLGEKSKLILFIFLFVNPLNLYVCNYVNSDPLFLSLSICWITQLLWIIHRPKMYHIFTHAILLLACFTVRNNAYFYPIISIFALCLSSQPIWRKVSGTFLSLTFILAFVVYERDASFKITGVHQFSLFTGWQLANNALYMYDKIEVDNSKLPTAETKELDLSSKEFVKSIPRDFEYRDYLQHYVGNYFIRQPNAPLKNYLWSHYAISGDSNQVEAWAKASVVFSNYGSWLIRRYPASFAHYFLILNTRNYFLPPLEKLELYNLGKDDVPMVVQDWFNYKTPNLWSISKTLQAYVLFIFPPLFLVVNLLFASSLLWILIKRYTLLKINASYKAILVSSAFIFFNFVFSVGATINVFRYQIFPMLLCLTSVLLHLELLENRRVAKIQLNAGEDHNLLTKERVRVEL